MNQKTTQIASNNMRVKQLNTELVKDALMALDNATKLAVARETGLSVATCGSILNELLERGEVHQVDFEQGQGGRPAIRYAYNPDYQYLAGLYISVEGGEFTITQAISNMRFETIDETRRTVDHIDFQVVDGWIERLLAQYDNIAAVSVGIPAAVNNGVIESDCEIESLAGFPLGQSLSQKHPVNIVVENDMNLVAIGFYKKQKYDSDNSVSVVNFPKDNCIGSGIIVNGHVLRGDSNFAGEVSYLPFGMTRDEQIRQFANRDTFVPLAVKTLVSIVATINPTTIMLTGELLQADMLEEIQAECTAIIPEAHMPELVVRESVHDDYVYGLATVALDSLSCDVRLVRKKL